MTVLPTKFFIFYCQDHLKCCNTKYIFVWIKSIMTKIIISHSLSVSRVLKIDWARKRNVMEAHLIFLTMSLNRSECLKIVCLVTSRDILTVWGICHWGTTGKFSLALRTLSPLKCFVPQVLFWKRGHLASLFLFPVRDRQKFRRADSKLADD